MSRLEWSPKPALLERGLDQGVLYLDDGPQAWNGLISVEPKPVNSESTSHYFDGRKLAVTHETGSFSADISAVMFPDALYDYEHGKTFGLSYRTGKGDKHLLHLVYNVTLHPLQKSYSTIGSSTDLDTVDWTLAATDVDIKDTKPAAHIVIDTGGPYPEAVSRLLEMVYGGVGEPYLPTPDEVVSIFEDYVTLRITYFSNGTWTANGPDDVVMPQADGTFVIDSPTAYYIDEHIYRVSSF